jgi:pimeloyl-ACP methyl ester carboxylesterase/tetratricopeptide (TPR) repeat protein
MNTKKEIWRFHGTPDEELAAAAVRPEGFHNLISATSVSGKAVRCDEGRAGVAADVDIEVGEADLVEAEFEDGMILYLSPESFENIFKSRRDRSADGDIKQFPRSFSVGFQQDRGIGNFVLKAFRVLKLKGWIAEHGAKTIAEKLEDQLIGGGGYLRWDRTNNAWKQVPFPEDTDKPILLFLHGTASCTEGSFGHLWQDGAEVWQALTREYGDNIYAFEHVSLSKSPIENAIELVETLPESTTLHLISHSRGGLIGELLCHAQLVRQRSPFVKEDFELFRREYHSQAGQLCKLGELLHGKKLKVGKFLRVACPARGTTLASERLDVYLSVLLNLAGLVTGLKSNPVFGFLQALALAVARKRTSPESLPGLEAMMPGSPFIAMLNRPGKTSTSPLAVIKGDIEASGIFQRLGVLMADAFYRADHDLVVNTDAMSGGVKRETWGAFLDRGGEVNHFRYFRNARTRRELIDVLLQPGLPASFTVPRSSRYVRSWEQSRGGRSGGPIAFVIPGLSGTNLEIEGTRIWLDLREIFRGRFRELAIDRNPEVGARLIMKGYYDDFMRFLGETHRVIPFPYDWRRSVLDASDRLAQSIAEQLDDGTGPIRLFAHSMGGLVVRGLMVRHPDLWEKLVAADGFRVILLGTPDRGSYSIFRLLVGQDGLSALLSLIDTRQDENQLLKMLAGFPGILELLPVYGETDAFGADIWEQLKQAMDSQLDELADNPISEFNPPTRWSPPEQSALDKAKETWTILSKAVFDRCYTAYIAGRAESTPLGLKITEAGRIIFTGTEKGDGRVPWEQGIPQNIPCWYIDAAHGDLVNHEASFEGLLEIAEKGDTNLLSRNRPATRSSSRPLLIPPQAVACYPDEKDIQRVFSGSEPWRKSREHEQDQVIQVSVVHCNLLFAKWPVMVGHYTGDAIVSAEKALDRLLSGRLQQRKALGLYPGRVPSSEVILVKNAGGQQKGAIVIGLGKVGELNIGDLSNSVRNGLKRYAMVRSELNEGDAQAASVSSLLIGSGEGGLTLQDVIVAILNGLLEANRALACNGRIRHQTIRNFQFVELYEDRAAHAQHILLGLRETPRFKNVIKVSPVLDQSPDGGRRRLAYIEDDGWWERILIKHDDGDESIKYVYLTNRARAESHLVVTQRRLVDRILEQATRSSDMDGRMSRLLFELLLPPEFKFRATRKRNLMLILDEASACYPWELLGYVDEEGNEQAPATQAGMMRQLESADFTRAPNMVRNHKALVAGDPLSSAPELPGARKEAKAVVRTLERQGFETTAYIRSTGLDIISALMTQEFQVIHLAAHGLYKYQADKDAPPVTGMLLDDELILTPAEIESIPYVPELVFINCCHLGRVDRQDKDYAGGRYKLAANLATQLIRKGVKAVVAAGWVVNDQAASLFAEEFYRAMFAGDSFGDAVQKARELTRRRFEKYNTWGAYQCYGDPGYRLTVAGSAAGEQQVPRFVCEQELIYELENLASDARSADEARIPLLKHELTAIVEHGIRKQWLDSARVQAAIGTAYAELDMFPDAIAAYARACQCEPSTGSIWLVEQLCNLQSLHAADLHDQGDVQGAWDLWTEARERLESLNRDSALKPSVERLALLGSIRKRQIMTKDRGFVGLLEDMRDRYTEADELAMSRDNESIKPYVRINRFTAQLLLSLYSESKDNRLPGNFATELGNLVEETVLCEFRSSNFMESIAHVESRLVQALFEENLAEQVGGILEEFQEKKKLLGSPRQFRSVLDNLQFLAHVLSGRRQEDAESISTIYLNLK